MKKRSLMVLLFSLIGLGMMYAQNRWNIEEQNATEILGGEDKYYVLQEGINNNGWAKFGYMNTGSADVIDHVENSCIYQFVQDGVFENEGVEYNVFVLKNLENGKFLAYDAATNTSTYTKAMSEAFHFTARQAKETGVGTDDDLTNWSEYSNAVSSASAGAEGQGTWVFCSTTEQRFIGFARNPSLWKYFDTNNWFVFEAHLEEEIPSESFFLLYDKYFSKGITDDVYPQGVNPGCVEKEAYDQLINVYNDALKLIEATDVASDVYAEMNKRIIDVIALVENHRIPVTPGYYVIQSVRSEGYLYDKNSTAHFTSYKEYPTAWDKSNSNIIWELTAAEAEAGEGRFYYRNFGTNTYLGKGGDSYPLTKERISPIYPEYYKNDIFLLFDGANYGNCSWGKQLCVWNDKADQGNHYRYIRVDQAVVDSLSALVEQEFLNSKLYESLFDVNSRYFSLKNNNGFSNEGVYQDYAPGLVKQLEAANATEQSEGSADNLFDNNTATYYHTAWQGEAPQDYHWIQVDLGKDVNDLLVKFSCRENNERGNPTRYAIVAPKAGEDAVWTDTLVQDTVIYNYGTRYGNGLAKATTASFNVKLGRPVQHIRFVVTETKSNELFGNGPFWYMSEMRFFDKADCVLNPTMSMVPEEVINALEKAISVSEKELAEGKATEKNYKELLAAFDAFNKAFPDPKALKDDLENAKRIAESANDSIDGIGYYKAGSPDALLQVVEAIQKEMEGDMLTKEDIARMKQQLETAMTTFYGNLIVPEAGKVYRIYDNGNVGVDEEKPHQVDAYIYALNADRNDMVRWGYRNDDMIDYRVNTLWLMESNEAGEYALKNLATGLYIDNPYRHLAEGEEVKDGAFISYSTTPQYFTFASVNPGSLVVTFEKGKYLNMSHSRKMCTWNNIYDINSQFAFDEVATDDFEQTSYIDVKEKKAQIVTLPMDVFGVYTLNGLNAMKVLGKIGNEIQLEAYEETEVIPAGVPFVIESDEAELFIETSLAVSTWNDLFQMNYNYNVEVQNGLVSAPQQTKPGAGYGLIIDNQVKISEKEDVVEAGTGFFNNAIPETETVGTYKLTINGEIVGVGTAIEDVVIEKNVRQGIYSITGVKVGNGESLKNLPKGVYILNGKKIMR